MSQKRVIYHEFADEYRSQIVDYLYKKHAWEPVLISANNVEPIRNWRDSKHKDCVLQSSTKLRQAQFDYSKIGKPVPIDAGIISSLSKYELNFLAMLGTLHDTTGWNYSFEERKQFYYDMLKYWNTVIHHLQPDLFVSFTWPHTPTCFSLYLLCKHYFNKDILFLDPVPFFDRSYHLIGVSLEKLYVPFIKDYESNENIMIGEDVREYFLEVRSEKGKISEYIVDVYKNDKVIHWNKLKSFIKLILSTVFRGTGFQKEKVAWKKNRKAYDSLDSRMNLFELFFFRERLRRKNIKLRKIYESYCIQPDLDKIYLYFAAPYQPEAVTATNGGVFEELFLVLDILSACVPEDWVIYYKEHPGTFLEGGKGALKRNKHVYDKVNSWDNVFMIPSQTDTFKLIDHSKAVATVAGTVAWEAVARGKPALSFGSAWYMGCKSIFSIKTLQDAQDAMEKIANGYTPDQTDIERYAAAIEKVAVKGMIHRNFDEKIKKCANPKYEIERIARALCEAYERHYGA